MFEYNGSVPLPLKANDNIDFVDDIYIGAVICFERKEPNQVQVKVLKEENRSSFPGHKFRVNKGSTPVSISLSYIDHDSEVPSVSAYKRALSALRTSLNENYRAMLKAHYLAKRYCITTGELAAAAGYEGYQAANLHYGTLARIIGEAVAFNPDGAATFAIATEGEKSEDHNHWQWVLRPQVVHALQELKWFEDDLKAELINNPIRDIEENQQSLVTLDATQKETIIQSRIGQGLFRKYLLNYWNGCAVTGCKILPVLKASHIKPWRDSNNQERLDPFNGLLLTPNLDAVFDQGLISFSDEGNILISPRIESTAAELLGINTDLQLEKVSTKHHIFLTYHRKYIFKAH